MKINSHFYYITLIIYATSGFCMLWPITEGQVLHSVALHQVIILSTGAAGWKAKFLTASSVHQIKVHQK